VKSWGRSGYRKHKYFVWPDLENLENEQNAVAETIVYVQGNDLKYSVLHAAKDVLELRQYQRLNNRYLKILGKQ